jgi:hypothetical protein
MIFPLSHRERGSEGERPVNQTKPSPLVDGYGVKAVMDTDYLLVSWAYKILQYEE